MDEEEAERILDGVKLHFTSYHKGIARFKGENDGFVFTGYLGKTTYEAAYNLSFKSEEDATDFLDFGEIEIMKDGSIIFEKDNDD
jgi:hypothetical protein